MEEKRINEDNLYLNEVIRCEELNVGHYVGSDREKQFVAQRVGVLFILRDKQKQTKTWEFFNAESGHDFSLENELQVSAKWIRLVNQQIGKLQRQTVKEKTA
jgi:hypothetical protein